MWTMARARWPERMMAMQAVPRPWVAARAVGEFVGVEEGLAQEGHGVCGARVCVEGGPGVREGTRLDRCRQIAPMPSPGLLRRSRFRGCWSARQSGSIVELNGFLPAYQPTTPRVVWPMRDVYRHSELTRLHQALVVDKRAVSAREVLDPPAVGQVE